MTFKLKKRCIRCLKVLRDDGTCQNPKCCFYVEESAAKNTEKASNSADPVHETYGEEVK